jgi:hypothetical protein
MPRLAEVIRAKINAGVLPREHPEKLFAGHGTDAICTACDGRILPGQVEWSIRDGDRVTHRFHIGCHGLWDAQLRKPGARVDHRVSRRTSLELVVMALRTQRPSGVCLSCLSAYTVLPLDVVASVVTQLGQTVDVGTAQRICPACGHQRELVRL